ncbi:hypothetical protein MRX96_034269 [Rhipicephalus microplus]
MASAAPGRATILPPTPASIGPPGTTKPPLPEQNMPGTPAKTSPTTGVSATATRLCIVVASRRASTSWLRKEATTACSAATSAGKSEHSLASSDTRARM